MKIVVMDSGYSHYILSDTAYTRFCRWGSFQACRRIYWQAFAYALWEQFIGVAIIIALSVLFREKYNAQGRLLSSMSGSVYTVYIIHAPVLVFLAISLRGVVLDPLLKFVLIAPLAVSI